MPALKLAIVMGGGVSLGSFSGGALAGALRSLNRQARDDGLELEIDILSGASAGGMSLGLLLRNLALPRPEHEGDFWTARVERPMHAAWVRKVGLEALTSPGERTPGSLLSSEALEALAGEMMSWPDGIPPRRTHPEVGVRLGRRVYFLATLMNLNGIPVVSRRLARTPALVDAQAATLFRDHRILSLDFDAEAHGVLGAPWPRAVHRDRDALSRPGTWQEMAELCLACGSFPIAFEPRVIARRAHEFGSLWPWRGRPAGDAAAGGGVGSRELRDREGGDRELRDRELEDHEPKRRGAEGGAADSGAAEGGVLHPSLWFDELDEFPFTYGDGGAFNNEPLREAMALIRIVDGAGGEDGGAGRSGGSRSGPSREEGDRRALLFIDPHLSGTAHTEFLGLHHPTRIRGNQEEEAAFTHKLLAQAGPTVSAMAGQAGFRDVRQADRVNQRLEWRGRLRGLLAELVDALPPDRRQALLDRSDSLLQEILETKQEAAMRAGAYDPTAELDRIRREEAENPSEVDPPGDGEGDSERRLRHTLHAVVDQVAALRDRRQVDVVAVGPLWEGREGEPPTTIPLAGAFFRRFGGFLRESFREHDYRWGLWKGARARLPGTPVAGSAAPALDGPDAPVPDASAPDGSAPDVSIPDAAVPGGSVPDPPSWPEDREWEEAGRTLGAAVRERYMEVVRELDSELDVRKRDFLLLGGAGGLMGFRRTMRLLFDHKLAPALERSVRAARVPGRDGVVRLRVRVEDGLGADGPAYRFEGPPGPPRPRGSRDWSRRDDGAAIFRTWVVYRLDVTPGAEARGRRTLSLEGGPHLQLHEGAGHGQASGWALRIMLADGGPLGPILPLAIPLGEGSAFHRWIRHRIHLLETPQEPLLQVTVDATDPTEIGVRWEAVPIAPAVGE